METNWIEWNNPGQARARGCYHPSEWGLMKAVLLGLMKAIDSYTAGFLSGAVASGRTWPLPNCELAGRLQGNKKNHLNFFLLWLPVSKWLQLGEYQAEVRRPGTSPISSTEARLLGPRGGWRVVYTVQYTTRKSYQKPLVYHQKLFVGPISWCSLTNKTVLLRLRIIWDTQNISVYL